MRLDLDSIAWASLTHAYGSAEDVPGLIRDLRSSDAEVRSAAMYELHGNIYHQGTRYEASAYAVPFLLELLADQAMIEVGRAQRTIFVARYLRDRDLQREINEGLNVVESWNRANSVIFFGKGGDIATNRRDEQELSVLCLGAGNNYTMTDCTASANLGSYNDRAEDIHG